MPAIIPVPWYTDISTYITGTYIQSYILLWKTNFQIPLVNYVNHLFIINNYIIIYYNKKHVSHFIIIIQSIMINNWLNLNLPLRKSISQQILNNKFSTPRSSLNYIQIIHEQSIEIPPPSPNSPFILRIAEINHAIKLSLSLSIPSPIFDSVPILSTSVWCSLPRASRIRCNFTIRWNRKLIWEFAWPSWRLRDAGWNEAFPKGRIYSRENIFPCS